ncbi:MAG: hypothetical protein NG740_04250 [Omnitrophica bacterium]|nr:hypothetical protein [Candidatus Omnitrophota bacterium]
MKTVNALSVFLLGLCLVLTAICAFAVTDDGYWKTDHTYVNFYALIGKISGLTNLHKGDEVAAFDNAGNCYGKGVVTDENGNYALSLYPAETGGTIIGPGGTEIPIPDNFAIPGFEENDKVIFKVYVKIESQPYPLEPTAGGTYRFASQGGFRGFPPATLNLAYNAPEPEPPGPSPEEPEPPGSEPPDEKSTAQIISGGLPYVSGGEKPPEVKRPSPVIRGRGVYEKEAPGMGIKEEVTPQDYYRVSPAPGQREVRRGKPATKEKSFATERPFRKPHKPSEVKRKRPKVPIVKIRDIKGWPLWLRILLFLIFMALFIVAGRKLWKTWQKP